MVRTYVKWPDSEMDRLVQRFFDKVGIDHRYVRGYRLDRQRDGFTTIEVQMIFDDEPAQTEAPVLDKAPGSEITSWPIVTTENPNIVRDDGAHHPSIKR